MAKKNTALPYSGFLVKLHFTKCPRCGKDQVYHNKSEIICLNCFNEFRKKLKGKKLEKECNELAMLLRDAVKNRF